MDKCPNQDKNKEEEHKAVLEKMKSENFQPPCLPYQRTVEHDDGTIVIINYD